MFDVLSREWLADFTPDFVCCIYPVTPLLKPIHIIDGFQQIKTNLYNYVFPAVRYSHPIQRAFLIDDKNAPKMFYPENRLVRTQDLTETYHDAGQFYWGKYNAWKQKLSMLDKDTLVMKFRAHDFIDVDNVEDLSLINYFTSFDDFSR